MSTPRPFELVPCIEGTTLKDPLTGQPMHSAIGPIEEARRIYLGPSRLQERLSQAGAPLVLWDVGMGIAANASVALELHDSRSLEIHSFENSLDGLRTALDAVRDPSNPFPNLRPLESNLRQLLSNGETFVKEHRWVLHSGDFREAIPKAPAAEVIFFDFYSPRVCGELWSVPVMEAMKARSPHSTLVTYSAATPVRLALLLAGWWVGRPGGAAPVTALKNESTVAVAEQALLPWIGSPFGPEWLEKFRSSTQARPYAAPTADPWSTASFDELEAALLKHPQLNP